MNTGRARYGWQRDHQGSLVEDEQQQRVIDLIIELHSQYYGYSAIARELTRREIPTARDRARWNPSVIRKIVDDNLDRMPLAHRIRIPRT